MEMELPNMELFCQFLCCLKAMYCEPVKELDTFQLSHLLSEILACVFHLVCSQVRPDDMEVKVECIFFGCTIKIICKIERFHKKHGHYDVLYVAVLPAF